VNPGTITYLPGDADSFHKAVVDAYSLSDEKHTEIVEQGYAHMKELYGIELINKIRMAVLLDLTSKTFEKNPRSVKDPLVEVWAYSMLKGQPGPAVPQEVLKSRGIA
jgi:hypothetical protein